MKLKQLECVVAVVQNGFSVTAAAESLHMSQPAVSKQIKLFEEGLGAQVFRRSSRNFVGMTALGDAVMPEIDKILAARDTIRQLGTRRREKRFAQLHIATTNTLARYRLADCLSYMHRTYSDQSLNIIEGSNTRILELLQNHEADFAWFSAMTLEPYQSYLRQIVLLPALGWSSVLVLPRAHRLAERGPRALSDLGGEPLVTYVTSHKGPSGLAAAMNAAGVAPRVVLTARNAETIKTYVRQGMGLGVIADMAYDPARDDDLAMWPLGRWLDDFSTYLAWHVEQRLREVHYGFIRQIVPQADRVSVQNQIRRVRTGQEAPGWAI